MLELVKRAVADAEGLGPKPRAVEEAPASGEDKGAHFAASVQFFRVRSGDGAEHRAVAKVQPDNAWARELMHSDLQFATEVVMYREIVPLLGVESLFPAMYFGRATGDPKEDIILLEDMRRHGFEIAKEKLFLSVEHLRLGVEALGKFHAASLAAKANQGERFKELVSRLKFTKYSSEDDRSVEACMARGFEPLMREHGDALRPALQALQSEDFLDLVTKANEPWAVVCHGDFCRNNIMFKFKDGRPISIKLFDLQTSRYSSPAIDLSFFLYLNTDKSTRDLYWDSLLQLYLSTLKSHLPPSFPLDEAGFYDDFSARAVYGYYHCSFFTPIMLQDEPPQMEDYAQLTPEQRMENMLATGGEEGTRLIADIVRHLHQKGYIERFVKFYKAAKNQTN